MTNWRVLPSLAILGSALVLDAKATRRVSVKAKKTGGEKGEITATHQVCCIGKENLTAPQKSEGAVVVWAKLLSQLAGYRGSGGDCILTATYKASVAPDQSKFPHLIHPDRQFSSSQRIPAGGDGTSLGQSKELPFQCAKIRVHAEGRLAAALHKNKPSNFFLPELILPLTEGTKKTTSVQIEFGTGIREGKESLSLTPSTDKLFWSGEEQDESYGTQRKLARLQDLSEIIPREAFSNDNVASFMAYATNSKIPIQQEMRSWIFDDQFKGQRLFTRKMAQKVDIAAKLTLAWNQQAFDTKDDKGGVHGLDRRPISKSKSLPARPKLRRDREGERWQRAAISRRDKFTERKTRNSSQMGNSSLKSNSSQSSRNSSEIGSGLLRRNFSLRSNGSQMNNSSLRSESLKDSSKNDRSRSRSRKSVQVKDALYVLADKESQVELKTSLLNAREVVASSHSIWSSFDSSDMYDMYGEEAARKKPFNPPRRGVSPQRVIEFLLINAPLAAMEVSYQEAFVNGITSLLDSSKHALFSVCALTVTMGKAASKSSLENDFRFTAAAPRFAQYQFSTLSDIKVPEGLINDESDCLVLAFLDFEKANYADSVFMSPVGSAVAIKVFLKPLSENGSSRELRPQTYVRVYEELSGRDFFEFFRDHEVAFNWAMKSGALLEMVAEQINRSGVWSPVVPKCSSGSILGCTGRSQTIL